MRRSIVAVLAAVVAVSELQGQYWLKTPAAFENWPGDARLAADQDGDGDVDLIRFDSSATPAAFRVLLNAGDGQFSDGATVPLPAQSGQHVALADVDGNDVPDVVVSTLSSSASGPGLLVFPGLPGATFGPSTHVPLAGNVLQLRTGNVNGDGIADLAVIHGEAPGSQHARWICGNPAHAFAPLAGLLFPSTSIKDLVVLDVNADGVDDFVMAHGSTIYFFFTDGASSPSNAGPFFPIASEYSIYLAAADVDGNGDLDLVAASTIGFTTLSLARLLNQGGSWTQLASQSIPSSSLGPIFLGDWDGNGAADLFLRDSDSSGITWGLYENDGTGTYTHRYTRSTSLPSGGGGAGLFELNGDGRLDFADAKGVFFGDGTFQDFLATPGQFHRRALDWEGDGDVDLAYERGEILKNDGRGVFTATSLGWPVPGISNHSFSSELFYADLDGDALLDVIISHVVQVFPLTYQFLEMRRFEDTGAGAFVDLGPCAPPAVEMVTSPLIDDVDGDGDLDLVNSQGIWFNDGAEFFSPPAGGPFQTYQPILKGDVDGDGDVDFIAAPFGAVQKLALLRRTAPGVLSLEVIYSQATSSMLNNAPALADLDNDGDLDIAVDHGTSGTVPTIYANNGAGVFAPALTFPVVGTLGQTTLAAGDFDGDGMTDLALGYSRRVRIYRRLGPGFVYDAPRTFVSGFSAARSFVDVDDDGDLDLMGSGNTIFNPRFDGAAAGFRRQYGTGVAGTGGRRPVLGKSGPLRVGYTATLRVREGLGGASGLLVVGLAEANLPDHAGLTGLTLYVDPITLMMPVQLSGAPGVAGAGSLDLPFFLSPAFGGFHVFVQAGFGDPGAPNGISTTNGMEESIGF
jgi:hypothetical protein